MSSGFIPRLSEARHLLALLRKHLVATSSGYPLPTGLCVDLVPIAEDGVFGYELIPDQCSRTYAIVGCNAEGVPTLRTTDYGGPAPHPLRLAAVNGQPPAGNKYAPRQRRRQRDTRFADWPEAAESAWALLVTLYPARPRQVVVLRESEHRALDLALSIAHSHLAQWNPCIHFCGVPNESQQGYVLSGAPGERGDLVFQRPDTWVLRWSAPQRSVLERWSVVVRESGGGEDQAGRDLAGRSLPTG